MYVCVEKISKLYTAYIELKTQQNLCLEMILLKNLSNYKFINL